MESKEHKIGECFIDGNTLLETRMGDCPECFYSNDGCDNEEVHGPCCEQDRTDETDVIFKEIKDMKEEKLNKDEHFYILGVPNRGKEVKELLLSKGIITDFKDESYSNEQRCFYNDNGCRFINKISSPLLYDLVTSNWTELKLPWKPKDKELVWAWDNGDDCSKVLAFYDIKNNCCFCPDGRRNGADYSYYSSFEGEYPEWAKEALNKLED